MRTILDIGYGVLAIDPPHRLHHLALRVNPGRTLCGQAAGGPGILCSPEVEEAAICLTCRKVHESHRRRCRVCGYNAHPAQDGRYWVDSDLCSRCGEAQAREQFGGKR